jgi:pimeloyl-ACP methyl ester carboxylesterase
LALDPAAFAVGAPDLPGLLAAADAAGAGVVLARGENDDLVTAEQLRALRQAAVDLPDLGHNAHVEDPRAVWRLIETAAAGADDQAGPGRSGSGT